MSQTQATRSMGISRTTSPLLERDPLSILITSITITTRVRVSMSQISKTRVLSLMVPLNSRQITISLEYHSIKDWRRQDLDSRTHSDRAMKLIQVSATLQHLR